MAQNEALISHPAQAGLVKYCSHFRLEHAQIKSALELNASQTHGRSFLYLQRKASNTAEFPDALTLFQLSGAAGQYDIDWNSLENALKTRQIFPLQKWQGCGELSIRLSNAAET